MRKIQLGVLILLCGDPLLGAGLFPKPCQEKETGDTFRFNAATVIVLPAEPTPEETRLAALLAREMTDRYGFALNTIRGGAVPRDRQAIIMGSVNRPLVKTEAAAAGLTVAPETPGPEGYTLRVTAHEILVAGSDDAGAYYGVQSLRQLLQHDATGVAVRGVEIVDQPYKSFRGVKVFLPGRDNLPFFRRFITDFMGLYKLNKLVLEVNAGMRLERHPELNVGAYDFARDQEFSRRDRPAGPRGEAQDSAHYDTADGGVLEKDEVAAIVQLAADNHIEVIPEIPALTHSYYLLARHRELAEVPTAEWPDTYCPSNPDTYKLLFDVLDEYIAVIHPTMVHVGHDEWRCPIDLCPLCKDKDHTQLFTADINKIHDYLTAKHLRMAIWGDHLIEPLRGKGTRVAGRGPNQYIVPGAISEAQVRASIPKDILMFNWFWGNERKGGAEESRHRPADATGEVNELRLAHWGFEQVYGNFSPGMRNYRERSGRPGLLGGAASCWAATTELTFGKDMVYDLLGIAPMLWTGEDIPAAQLLPAVQAMMPGVRERFSGVPSPRGFGGELRTVSIQRTGSASIPIGEDATSLTFVHAAAEQGEHLKTAKVVYNAADTSELLGAYEIAYDDGLVVSVPIRYAWNILEQDWTAHVPELNYCYAADARLSDRGNWFAYEWTNPRLGHSIKEVRLRSFLRSNPITLQKIEVLAKRPVRP